MPFDHRRYRPQPRLQLSDRRWPDRVLTQAPRWASVDLRDGNQALRAPMTVAQKQRLWDLLLAIGIKEIEVGFPAASQPDYDFVRWLIETDRIPADVTIQVLVQARESLIERTFAALDGAARAIVHVYNSTSPVQRDWVFKRDRAGVCALAEQGAAWVQAAAARYPETAWTFQYSPESFSQTEPEFALAVCTAVLGVWQPTPQRPAIINLPATVESASPNCFADQVEWFCRGLDAETNGRREGAISVSVHTHNDRGGAVAAAELALLAGADRVEGTLLGNGERTGNMDLITLAMNLYSQGIDPGLDLSDPRRIIDAVEACTGIPCHPRHPWVGELVYTAFSGSHQDAIRKCLQRQQAQPDSHWQVAYLPIDPRDIGRSYEAVIRVNSQSGKGGISFVLERDFGLSLPRWLQTDFAAVVQRESETRGGIIDAARLQALFRAEYIRDRHPVALLGYRLRRNGQDRIEVRLRRDGREQTIVGTGAGAITAFAAAWADTYGECIDVRDYQEHAIGSGTEAEAAAYVQIDLGGQVVPGAAIDRDSVGAALRALISALNRAADAVPATS